MGRKGDIYRYIVTGSIGVVSCMGYIMVPEHISCHILPTGQYKGNVRHLSYSTSVELYGAGGIRWKGWLRCHGVVP